MNDADVKKLEEPKKEMEAELKSLKKAMGPHKMWASNNKITVKQLVFCKTWRQQGKQKLAKAGSPEAK